MFQMKEQDKLQKTSGISNLSIKEFKKMIINMLK